MSIGIRIKELRKALGLSQQDLSKSTLVSRSYLASLEIDRQPLNERILRLICQEFNVNEVWFRTGEGDMFNKVNTDLIDSLCTEYKLDSLDKQIIYKYINLNEFERKVIKDFICDIFN